MENILNGMFSNGKYMYWLIGIVGFAIFALTISIIYILYEANDKKSFRFRLKEQNEIIYNQAIKDITKNEKTLKIYEKLDFMITRSGLKYKYKFNPTIFTFLVLEFFFFGMFLMFDTTQNYTFSLTSGLIISFIPFIFLEILASKNTKSIKGQILSLIPLLINNAKLSRGDIVKTISMSAERTNYPMKLYLEEFNHEIKSGIPTDDCFVNLKNKIGDYRFNRVIDALSNHMYKGGNVVVTLSSIHQEYLLREIEEDRRRKENSSSALGIYVCILFNFLILYAVNLTLPEIIDVLEKNQYIITIALINTVLSLFIGFKSTRASQNQK